MLHHISEIFSFQQLYTILVFLIVVHMRLELNEISLSWVFQVIIART